jgi:hypothetical protein
MGGGIANGGRGFSWKKVREIMGINIETFLGAVFVTMTDDENILLARQTSLAGGFKNAPWPGKVARRWLQGSKPHAVYFNVSTVREPEVGEDGSRDWRRRKNDCIAAHVLVLDDIGTKVGEEPPIAPSYKIETSKGNYQWGYFIEPYEDLERYDAIVSALGGLGFTDTGAGGYNRLMRVPGSINIKPGRGNFVSEITEWNPKRQFVLDDLARDLGVNLENLKTGKTGTVLRIVAGDGAIENKIEDPLLAWLEQEGRVVADDGGDWVEINCPWSDEHTSGLNTAGYSPLGRGADGWIEMRGFKCHHEHCADRRVKEFLDWVETQGGPTVMGVEILPWLEERYVYVSKGRQVADMHQRPLGGVWQYTLDEWSNMYYQRIRTANSDNFVLVKTAFLASRTKREAVDFRYVPGGDDLVKRNEQTFVNTYIESRHPETDREPTVFHDHMEYLLPDKQERECFLNWLARKIQYPAERSYAVVMVADESYGIGRSWVGRMLERVLEGKVNKASLGQLIGKGTHGERTYNDWAAECQFLVVEEAKDISKEDFWSSYETFKERIDNKVTEFWRNTKYGAARYDYMHFNCLIFSNHADAMALPEGERRVAVFSNPTKRRSKEYYERLDAALNSDEPARVYWWLKRRDLSGFDHVYPPDTPAKAAMVEQSRNAYDEIFEFILEYFEGDIVTRKILMSKVEVAARELGYDNVKIKPGAIANRIWRQIKSLRPTEGKNGARYLIDTKQAEVRALRNYARWKNVDEDRDREQVIVELKKNVGGSLHSLNFPANKRQFSIC